METFTLKLPKRWSLTDDEFYDFCQENDAVQLERNAHGEILIMSPTGGITGKRNKNVLYELETWNRQHQLGETFDSSTGFKLPNGATRSPDACWIEQSRWDSLSTEQQKKFPPLCPDFVVELVSESDSLPAVQQKMEEWVENGVRLGWLFQPTTEAVFIYRATGPVARLQGYQQTISGEDVLPGFRFDLRWLR